MAKRGRPFGSIKRAKEVNFFAGLKTPSKADDKQVRFNAKIKNPLEAPKELSGGIPIGEAEMYGMKFDAGFGLAEEGSNPFSSKVGIDPNFGLGQYDASFSKGFAEQKFNIQSFGNSYGNSTMISDDYSEPNEAKFVSDFDRDMQKKVPALLDSLPTGRRVPLTDGESRPEAITRFDESDKKLSKNQKLERKYNRIRSEALATGANPLSPEEKRNFFDGGVYATRNFGTTSKKSIGKGFGRY